LIFGALFFGVVLVGGAAGGLLGLAKKDG